MLFRSNSRQHLGVYIVYKSRPWLLCVLLIAARFNQTKTHHGPPVRSVCFFPRRIITQCRLPSNVPSSLAIIVHLSFALSSQFSWRPKSSRYHGACRFLPYLGEIWNHRRAGKRSCMCACFSLASPCPLLLLLFMMHPPCGMRQPTHALCSLIVNPGTPQHFS